jgi:hypothetical protein
MKSINSFKEKIMALTKVDLQAQIEEITQLVELLVRLIEAQEENQKLNDRLDAIADIVLPSKLFEIHNDLAEIQQALIDLKAKGVNAKTEPI